MHLVLFFSFHFFADDNDDDASSGGARALPFLFLLYFDGNVSALEYIERLLAFLCKTKSVELMFIILSFERRKKNASNSGKLIDSFNFTAKAIIL